MGVNMVQQSKNNAKMLTQGKQTKPAINYFLVIDISVMYYALHGKKNLHTPAVTPSLDALGVDKDCALKLMDEIFQCNIPKFERRQGDVCAERDHACLFAHAPSSVDKRLFCRQYSEQYTVGGSTEN